MIPVNFSESNGTLNGGDARTYKTENDVIDLPVHRTSDGQIISCWAVSEEERMQLLRSDRVWLSVLAGQTHHPVTLLAESPFGTSPAPGEWPKAPEGESLHRATLELWEYAKGHAGSRLLGNVTAFSIQALCEYSLNYAFKNARATAAESELQQLYAAFAGVAHSPKNPQEAKQAIEQMSAGGFEQAGLELARELAEVKATLTTYRCGEVDPVSGALCTRLKGHLSPRHWDGEGHRWEAATVTGFDHSSTGAGGGDEAGYDMTGCSGPTSRRDVRNFLEAHRPRLGETALATLLRYIDGLEEQAAAVQAAEAARDRFHDDYWERVRECERLGAERDDAIRAARSLAVLVDGTDGAHGAITTAAQQVLTTWGPPDEDDEERDPVNGQLVSATVGSTNPVAEPERGLEARLIAALRKLSDGYLQSPRDAFRSLAAELEKRE